MTKSFLFITIKDSLSRILVRFKFPYFRERETYSLFSILYLGTGVFNSKKLLFKTKEAEKKVICMTRAYLLIVITMSSLNQRNICV